MSDDLGKLLRDARPGEVRRGSELSERARRELAFFEAAESELERGRQRRGFGELIRSLRPMPVLGGAFVLAMVVVAAVVFTTLRPIAAVALTPPMLAYTSVSESSAELLTELSTQRLAGGAPGNVIRSQVWALNTEIAEDGTITSSSVEPQERELVFHPDGSVSFQLTTTAPFPGQESAKLPAPGTVLSTEEYPAGGFDNPYPEAMPSDSALIGAYLARVSGNDALTAGDAVREISGIMSSVILDRAQEAAAIAYLGTLKGLSVAGAVVDRLDRPGIAFRATDRFPGEVEDVLILSPSSGKILASETIYVGASRPDIDAPSVIDYTAWER